MVINIDRNKECDRENIEKACLLFEQGTITYWLDWKLITQIKWSDTCLKSGDLNEYRLEVFQLWWVGVKLTVVFINWRFRCSHRLCPDIAKWKDIICQLSSFIHKIMMRVIYASCLTIFSTLDKIRLCFSLSGNYTVQGDYWKQKSIVWCPVTFFSRIGCINKI